MIITTGREISRYSEKPLVRTLRLSPHQANHGYLTRFLPGLFLPVEKSFAELFAHLLAVILFWCCRRIPNVIGHRGGHFAALLCQHQHCR